jgi:hypothetical protein
MADLLAIAETLEAQAASLRREAARIAAAGQAELELEPQAEWRDHDGSEQPTGTYGKNVDVALRDGEEWTGPANVCAWQHDPEHPENGQIARWRLSAEQPETP